ncbi:MAG TPA: MoaD/ThiS family protein [Acidobacteriaceae bacterium]|nr:MoaD/ThiS family protein [Acidobacteriaceae bacterium]
MRVRVLYFGVLKERFGAAEEPVELPEGSTVGELVRVLRGRSSNAAMSTEANVWSSLAVAVDREYSAPDTVLRDDSEVALLPPVSGGLDGERLTSLAVADRSRGARAMPATEIAG